MFHTLQLTSFIISLLILTSTVRSDINCDDARVYHKDLSQAELNFLLAFLPGFHERPAAITALETSAGLTYQVITTCDEGYDWVCEVEMSSSEYQDFFDDNAALGYRPLIVETHGTYPNEKYLSVMINDGVPSRGRHRTTKDEWLEERQELLALDYEPVWFSSCGTGSTTRYASVWTDEGNGAFMRTLTNVLPTDFDDYEQVERYEGCRLISVSVHGSSSSPRIGGFFTETIQPEWSVHTDLSSLELNSLVDDKEKAGWEAYVITAYEDSSSTRYIAVFQRDPARTFRITGTDDPGFESLDAVMEAHMKNLRISRGQLAVTDSEGRLVLARAYTWESPDTTDTVPENLFRIASVSKPITAVAVMAMFEDGLMGSQTLDDPVAALLTGWNWCQTTCSDCQTSFCTDPNWPNITYRHLLSHYSGIVNWSNGSSGDAMGANRPIRNFLNTLPEHERDPVTLPISLDDIHKFMRLQGVDSTPGSTFQYSNYGYSLLGRIIEAASGMDYEDYVQERVFDPLCISRMQIGSTLGNADNEVDYHDAMYEYRLSILDDDDLEWVHSPYGVNNIANFDAHGGWIGTAVDLVAFASAFRDPADSPLLTEASIDDMWDAPTSLSYSLGWDFDPGSPDRYHNGSITGTKSTMQRNNDGTTFAVVLNRRVGNNVPGYNSGDDDIRALINDSAWSAITWPAVDYWNDYLCIELVPADINFDGSVDVLDLLEVINQWGPCPLICPADVNDDGAVNVLDLLAVLESWGS